MKIRRAFGVTFGLDVLTEAIVFFLDGAPFVVGVIVFGLRYVLLVVLGFMLARKNFGYGVAFANTLPFVVLWFVVVVLDLQFGAGVTPPDWSAHDDQLALWGFGFASILFLPLAFGASALGVLLGRVARRIRAHSSNAT